MSYEVRLGMDVEFFARDKYGQPLYVDGYDFNTEDDNFSIYDDNALLEWKNDEPDTCRQMAAFVLNHVKRNFKRGPLRGAKLEFRDIIELSRIDMEIIGDTRLKLGCSPDRSAYTRKKQTLPRHLEGENWRCLGGHIHFGVADTFHNGSSLPPRKAIQLGVGNFETENNPLFEAENEFILNLDATIGLMSVIFNRRNAKQRRKMYGKAGSFRRKPYGLEYRVLDNSWTGNINLFYLTLGVGQFVFEQMKHDIENGLEGKELLFAKTKEDFGAIHTIINDDMYADAEDMLKKILSDNKKRFILADEERLRIYRAMHRPKVLIKFMKDNQITNDTYDSFYYCDKARMIGLGRVRGLNA